MQGLCRTWIIGTVIAVLALLGQMTAGAQQTPPTERAQNAQHAATNLDINDLLRPQSELRGLIERYETDLQSLNRSLPISFSPAGYARLQEFYAQWLAALQKIDFAKLSQDGRVDYLLLKNHIEYEQRRLDIEHREQTEMAPLLPFAPAIIELVEARRRMEPIDAAKAAATISALSRQIAQARKAVEAGTPPKPAGARRAPSTCCTTRCSAGTTSITATTRCLPGGCRSPTR